MDADLPDLRERAETLDNVRAGLLDDVDVADDDDEQDDCKNKNGDQSNGHSSSSFGFSVLFL